MNFPQPVATSWRFNPGKVALTSAGGLILLGALLILAGPVSAAPLLSQFAGGATTTNVSLNGCPSPGSQLSFDFPADSFVVNGSIHVSPQSGPSYPTGPFHFDVGADGSVDFNRSLEGIGINTFRIDAAPFNEYLAAHPNGTSSVTVPVAVTACLTGNGDLVFDEVKIYYTVDGSRPPLYDGRILPITNLTSGESIAAGIDLSDYFSDGNGDALNYTIKIAYAWIDTGSGQYGIFPAKNGGLNVTLSGSNVSFHSNNASHWGGGSFTIIAKDPTGLVSEEAYMEVWVRPRPEAPLPTTISLTMNGSNTMTVPAGAVVFAVQLDSNASFGIAWKLDGIGIGPGPTVSTTLAPGTHNISVLIWNSTANETRTWQVVATGAGSGPGPGPAPGPSPQTPGGTAAVAVVALVGVAALLSSRPGRRRPRG